ncbi:hypothetical protein CAPTEDRAFT_89225 [Capitella teleta]|uniref:Sorting nexin-25 n=1 Tax=Capitella teleta TaxID=283909 RepID=R7UEI9_CAPTE|nr:hypothetical protein CAPTEDRAFT_89225 [Capitella teleta]|eukprot:ELU04949.1 hypothetical protein CAPTEDRAFT_89225 [Capitella teleta]
MSKRHNFYSQEKRHKNRFSSRKTVTTKNLDVAIQQIFDLIVQDYVHCWYKDLGIDYDYSVHVLHDDWWVVVTKFCHRLEKINWVSFLARDVVNALTRHFHEVKLASKKYDSAASPSPPFILHPWLASPEKEQDFLRKCAEVLLLYLLPDTYAKSDEIRHLFREILAVNVFQPAMDMICHPDYINQKIVECLNYKEFLATEQTKTFTYAASYEEFMKMIELCQDVEYLKQLRYNIISEIMQATTIQNLKRAKGMDTDKETAPKGTMKGDLLKARNLKRYLNQLSITKNFCEKRINFLGGPDYRACSSTDSAHDLEGIPGRKVLSFEVVMATPEARHFFMKYLQRIDMESLLGFWTSVENMKLANKRNWHHMATEIFQMFVTPSVSHVKNHLQRSTVRHMEAFMMGDKGPEAFWRAQTEISTIMEETHYPSFILSDIYHQYIMNYDEEEDNVNSEPTLPAGSPLRNATFCETTSMRTRRITLHSNYAQEKLQDLDEKILNKTQALKALKSQRSEPRIQRLMEDIQRETMLYHQERQVLVSHIERTDLWAVNLGRWRAIIHNSRGVMQEDCRHPSFLIVVHLPEVPSPSPTLDSAHGWSIKRTLDDFKALQKELAQISPDLKKKPLPRIHKFGRRSSSSDSHLKMSSGLQDFLENILSDEHLSQSEAVFAFLSPSPEHLKSATDAMKQKESVSFPNLFKKYVLFLGVLSGKQHDSDSEEELMFGETLIDDHSRDWVADPMYMLIGEVFELRGVFKWLRRSLMGFVQVTFGHSINNQVCEMVNWLLSQSMLIFYLNTFRESYWPDGKLARQPPVRSEEERLRTRLLAKQKVLQSIPDVLKNLVGEANAKNGAIKLFEYFQDIKLNKHLFYVSILLISDN